MANEVIARAIHSYGVATRTGQKPRHLLHVHQDGGEKALCGIGPVRFIGEVGQPYGEEWPFCKVCVKRLNDIDPELGEGWFPTTLPHHETPVSDSVQGQDPEAK